MKKNAIRAFGTVSLLLFLAYPAWARQCPTLIKEGRGTLAKVKLSKAEEERIKALLDEAQKLHDKGSHSASVKKANEAFGLLKKK